jgi:hypothetical protein
MSTKIANFKAMTLIKHTKKETFWGFGLQNTFQHLSAARLQPACLWAKEQEAGSGQVLIVDI